MLKSEDFFDLSRTRFKNLFEDTEYVWDALKKLKKYIGDNINPNVSDLRKKGEILIGKTLVLYDDKAIESGFDIRILQKKLVVDGCVVGHTTELKSCVMLGESKAGHFAYIGDSILGKVNLGAGTKLANLKIVESKVVISIERKRYEKDLRKLGAILADGVETGGNSVTTPGTLLGKDVLLYPNTTARDR